MSKWVTNPDALRAVLALRGIQVGDQVRERSAEGKVATWTVDSAGYLRAIYSCYSDKLTYGQHKLTYDQHWTFVGWKPRRKK